MKPFTFEQMEQTLTNYKQFKLRPTKTDDLTQQEFDSLMQKQVGSAGASAWCPLSVTKHTLIKCKIILFNV